MISSARRLLILLCVSAEASRVNGSVTDGCRATAIIEKRSLLTSRRGPSVGLVPSFEAGLVQMGLRVANIFSRTWPRNAWLLHGFRGAMDDLEASLNFAHKCHDCLVYLRIKNLDDGGFEKLWEATVF